MNLTDASANRANRHGDKCPEWCAVDHHKEHPEPVRYIDCHISDSLGSGPEWGPGVRLVADGVPGPYRQPLTQVQVHGPRGITYVSPSWAGALADVLESLASEPPSVLLALADEIRTAAGTAMRAAAAPASGGAR